MKKMVFVLMTLVFTAIGYAQTKTFYLNSQQKSCTGAGPMQCIQYKEKQNETWKLLYQPIEGFTYEEGFLYKLKVKQVRVKNPPADGSSVHFVLKKVISKEKDNNMEVQLAKAPDGKYLLTALLMDGKLTDVSGKAYEVAFRKADSEINTKICNNICGRFTVDGNKIKFGPMRSTRMMCPDMSHENALSQAFAEIDNFSYEKAKLHLKKGDQILVTLIMPVN
jgi:heat shock protein HslJ